MAYNISNDFTSGDECNDDSKRESHNQNEIDMRRQKRCKKSISRLLNAVVGIGNKLERIRCKSLINKH